MANEAGNTTGHIDYGRLAPERRAATIQHEIHAVAQIPHGELCSDGRGHAMGVRTGANNGCQHGTRKSARDRMGWDP